MKIVKDVRSVFIGIVIGPLLAIPVISFASVGEKVTAVFSTFKFVVNGEQKTLDADPLVYQGSTYLPVKVVSNMLGYDITYKADSRTIELNNQYSISNNKIENADKDITSSNQSKILNQLDWISVHEIESEPRFKLYAFSLTNGYAQLVKFSDMYHSKNNYEIVIPNIESVIINGESHISKKIYNEIIIPYIEKN